MLELPGEPASAWAPARSEGWLQWVWRSLDPAFASNAVVGFTKARKNPEQPLVSCVVLIKLMEKSPSD